MKAIVLIFTLIFSVSLFATPPAAEAQSCDISPVYKRTAISSITESEFRIMEVLIGGVHESLSDELTLSEGCEDRKQASYKYLVKAKELAQEILKLPETNVRYKAFDEALDDFKSFIPTIHDQPQ